MYRYAAMSEFIRPTDVASCLAGLPQPGDEVEQERLKEPAILTTS
jgi:hypothetical protein